MITAMYGRDYVTHLVMQQILDFEKVDSLKSRRVIEIEVDLP
jgi:hypothetical protein